MITRTISHYEILAPLGEGGMGVVYRALDTRLGRPVALKLLRHDGPIYDENRKRFVQEARAASALNHPHIITIYDIGQDVLGDFIAMEYVAGQSLAQLIERQGLEIGRVLTYAVEIADALSAAHSAGILHRDLKPANIMVGDKGSIKILDFGVAKLTDSTDFRPIDERARTETAPLAAEAHTDASAILGTTAYMAPEQAQGIPADARSDVFSFGAVLYEMVTGHRAFGGETRMATLAAILTKEPEAPSTLVPGLSPDLEKLILRCLRKNPGRRWQSMADLKVALEDLKEEFDSRVRAVPEVPPARRGVRSYMIALTAAVAAALLGVAWWRTTGAESTIDDRPFLTQLTSDVGWTDYPAVSLDGKFLAYASDRSGEGNLDIWIQQIPDGSPVRLTRGAADEIEPAFSADGSRIAFQSSRMGGGIYVVPTLGGDERLLAARGFVPRFSPDGNWIAYGVAEQGGGGLYVAPTAGGPATAVAADFYRTQAHVWSPDGRHLLFWGQRHRDAPAEGNIDWYVVAVPDGAPTRMDARSVMRREKFRAFQGLPFPDAWTAGNRVLFHASVGDSSNIWRVVAASEPLKVSGAPQRVTFGTTDEAAAAVTSDGRLVFISRTMGADIWSLPIDANRARVQGALKRVTQDAAEDYDPGLSDDGGTVVFRSRRVGRFAVVLRKLGTDAETILTRMSEDHHPAISRDGSKVAYSFPQKDKMPIFVVSTTGGMPEQVCDDCGAVEDWSPDGNRILYLTSQDPSGVGLLTIGSSHDDAWLHHPRYGIYNPRLSSDGRWIAFNGRTDRLAPAQILIARIERAAVATDKDWIVASTDGDAPAWSPDANVLYFWSDRDGSPCLWAQRLDPPTKRPIGTPVDIHHFHSRAVSWKNLHLGAPGIAVARDKIVFNLGEHTGNIWMTGLPR